MKIRCNVDVDFSTLSLDQMLEAKEAIEHSIRERQAFVNDIQMTEQEIGFIVGNNKIRAVRDVKFRLNWIPLVDITTAINAWMVKNGYMP